MTQTERKTLKCCEIDGIKYELMPMVHPTCQMCVGDNKGPWATCDKLPCCSPTSRPDGLDGVWIVSGSQWHDLRVVMPAAKQEVIARLDAPDLEVVGAIYDDGKWYYCEEDARQEIDYDVIGWLTRLEAAAILDGGAK